MHPELIKAELRMRGWSGARIADSIGVSRSMVAHVIAGQAVSSRVMNQIAKVIEQPVEKIFPEKFRVRRTRQQMIEERIAAASIKPDSSRLSGAQR